jgi:hypothetical protein
MKNLELLNENAHNVLIPTNACIYSSSNVEYPGVALPGYFAASAFIKSDEAFDNTIAESFGWYDFEDCKVYRDSKYNFRRPTAKEWNTLFTEEQRNNLSSGAH